jgi:hypothetical protein
MLCQQRGHAQGELIDDESLLLMKKPLMSACDNN